MITCDLKFSPNTSFDKSAASLRAYLGVSIEEQASWKGVDNALEKRRDVFATEAGVYVYKDAFRAPNYFGFCVYDDEFPIIYINNSSVKSRCLGQRCINLAFTGTTSAVSIGGNSPST